MEKIDYGKLAYFKTDDLVKRIVNLERKQTVDRFSSIKLTKHYDSVINNSFNITGLGYKAVKDNVTTALIRLKLSVSNAQSMELKVSHNGAAVLADTIDCGVGAQDYFVMVMLSTINGYNELGLVVGQNGFEGRIISYEIMLWGDSLSGSADKVKLIAKRREAAWFVGVVTTTSALYFCGVGETLLDGEAKVIDSDIVDFDAEFDGSGAWILALVDSLGKVKLSRSDSLRLAVGMGFEYELIRDGAEAIAMSAKPSGELIIAVVGESLSKVFEIDKEFNLTNEYMLPLPIYKVSSMRVAEGGERMVLVLSTWNDKVYIKPSLNCIEVVQMMSMPLEKL